MRRAFFPLALVRDLARDVDPRAARNGTAAALALVAAIYLGSGRLARFDTALIAYTSASVFACFGIVYRYSVWLQKPSTGLYWKRGWQVFLEPGRLPANLAHLAILLWRNIVAQTFISARGTQRWVAHMLISWGCISAAAVTFPLVFGWVHFEADPLNPAAYQAFVFGWQAGGFPAHSLVGWLTFHVLDFSAIAILIALPLALSRRLYDPGAAAVQQFGMDYLPLWMLFAISVTGLMLTASSLWMHGHSYSFLALLHAFCVIVTLLYLPFGKFFHVFQRPAQLGVNFYKQEGAAGPQAECISCGEAFASRLHVDDLKEVLDRLGLDQRLESGGHYQEVCPGCRRRTLARQQLEAIGGPGFL